MSASKRPRNLGMALLLPPEPETETIIVNGILVEPVISTDQKIKEMLEHDQETCANFVTQLTKVRTDSKYNNVCVDNILTTDLIGKGKFGKIYNHADDDNVVIKRSQMIDEAMDNYKKCMESNALTELMEYFIHTPEMFEKIKIISEKAPKNINTIYSISQCKLNPIDDFPINQYYMKKIKGQTLQHFASVDSDNLLKIYLQLLYVIELCNINGLYHNDLTHANIMIEQSKEDNILDSMIFELNGNICKIVLTLTNTYIPVLIDFEIGYINNNINIYPFEINSICELFTRYSHMSDIVGKIRKINEVHLSQNSNLIRRSPHSVENYIPIDQNGYMMKCLDSLKIYHKIHEHVKEMGIPEINVKIIINSIDVTEETIENIILKMINVSGGGLYEQKYNKYLAKNKNILKYIGIY
jgi:tRNA A-37 threonylcarbamoyl transferase component Bud32